MRLPTRAAARRVSSQRAAMPSARRAHGHRHSQRAAHARNVAPRRELRYRFLVVRIIVVALLGLGSIAHADDFASFELAFGGHLPVGDSAWKSATTGSPAAFAGV